jgi:Acetyltransferase (GNAT) domain
MQPLIAPIEKFLLEKELNDDRFVRKANNGSNEIYIVTIHNSPHVLQEIGRIRELTFRHAGGGTGKEVDLDEFDLAKNCYHQLIVWNPADKEIVGGYRFIRCAEAEEDATNQFKLATTELFRFSDDFIKNFLPHTIELGRSFVQPHYQPTAENRKGLFSLDNLWDGLGAIAVDNPDIQYFFGKVTMYLHFNREARDMILFFMKYFFPDNEKLVIPHHPLPITHNMAAFEKELQGLSYKEGHHLLNKHVRALGENIPPLFNSYMNLSASMKTFGTALNTHFGDVEETGILVTLADIYESKKERHVNTYIK